MAKVKRNTKRKEKGVRPLGDVLLELEPLMEEMVDGHDLQHGDVLNLIYGYLVVHYPGAKEEYMDGTNPKFYYGEKNE